MRQIILTASFLILLSCDKAPNTKAIDPLLGGALVLNEEEIAVDSFAGMSACVQNIGIVINALGNGDVRFCDGKQKTIKKDRKLYEKVRLIVAPFRKISKRISESDSDMTDSIPCDSRATDSMTIMIRWDNDHNVMYDLGCTGPATLTAQTKSKEIIAVIEALQTD